MERGVLEGSGWRRIHLQNHGRDRGRGRESSRLSLASMFLAACGCTLAFSGSLVTSFEGVSLGVRMRA